MKTAVLTTALMLLAGAAAAQETTAPATPPAPVACVPPVVPEPYQPVALPPKPTLPPCVNPVTHVSKCSKAVIDKYNAAIDARNAAMDTLNSGSEVYMGALSGYIHDVNRYQSCEVRRLNSYVENSNG